MERKKLWSILSIIFGFISLIQSAVETEPAPALLFFFISLFAISVGTFNLVLKHKKKQKQICDKCGYIAIDDRELHNHQIECIKHT